MADSFLSSSWHRVGPLRPRLRPNLTVNRHRVQGNAWYVLHDGVTGKVYRFTPSVYSVIGAMNGRRSVDEIWRDAAERLGDEAPSQTAIVTLLSQLHAADLLQAGVASDAAELFRRYSAQRRRERFSRFMNPMSIRVPLIDPDRFLAKTVVLFRPFVSWFGLMVWLMTMGTLGVLLGPYWSELTGNIADRVLSADGLLLLAILFPLLKAIHELGHAYAIKSGGGEVHEMGVMLIAFMPVPYVEGSASAAFRSKWRRAGVAAAGMLVETFVAALAGIAWLLVEPGVVRAIAFNVMLIAGVSTLVFNANPLLRLDGYFILADLIEVPNLAQRATRFWGWLVERKLFGAEVERPASTAIERFWFVLYAPAAFAYRMIVLAAIALFLMSEWFVIGAIVAILGVLIGILFPTLKLLGFVLTSPQLQRVRGHAIRVTVLGLAAVLAFLLLVPLPLRTTTEGVIWLPDDAFVRAGVNGVIHAVVAHPGSRVQPGDLLLEGEDPVLIAEVGVLRAQIEALNARLESEQFADRVRAEVTRQEILAKRDALGRAEERLAALQVRAAISGIVEIPRPQQLEGRWVRRGDVLGYITQGAADHVRVVVPQADIDLVRQRLVGAQVLVPGALWQPLSLRLVREVPAASDKLPSRALAVDSGGRVAVDTRDPKGARSLERWFQLDFELPPGVVQGSFGSRAYIRFDHGTEPLGFQWWRRGRQLLLARLNA